MTRTSTFLTVVAALVATPSAALACGGLFCSSANLVPIEQNAERILFEIHGDGTISSTVEISYTGLAEDFAWVVPIPDTPTLDVVPSQTLALLDTATAPTLVAVPWCGGGFMEGGSGGGCSSPFGCQDSLAYASSERGVDYNEGDDGVDVVDLPQVGPYDSQVVSSDDPQALLDWLADNQYLLTEAMQPFVAAYAASGSRFLAMKLAPGADVGDIQPLRMTYPAVNPTIPLVLTSVSAEPEMGVMVFVAGAGSYESANWSNLQIDSRALRVDPFTLDNSYYPLVSWLVDQAGGKAFVTEYSAAMADPAAFVGNSFNSATYGEEMDWIGELNGRHDRITRMYTRISGWEMDSDPVFAERATQDVSNLLDMSEADCQTMDPGMCGATYCGEGAECAQTEVGAACVCPEGSVARQIEEPALAQSGTRPAIMCQQVEFELFGSLDGAPVVNACGGVTCGGGGECVVVNGFATCDCADGGAAIATESGPECVEALETFGPEALLPGADAAIETALHRVAPTHMRAGVALLLLAAFGPLMVRRRR